MKMMSFNNEDSMLGSDRIDELNKRFIKQDLLPVNEKDITEQWAKETYNHCHLFSKEVTGTVWDSYEDLKHWMHTATNLMKDIKFHGIDAGKKRIVHLANHKYNLTLPSKGKGLLEKSMSPVNLNDVVEIISDPEWYNENTFEKQDIIHDLIYGITRKSNNFWLITAEKEWMEKHNVFYSVQRRQRITESRGFVYKLMNSIFSNSTIRMFKRAMLSSLGEYISVRDNAKLLKKIESGQVSDYSVTSRNFSSGKGYIIKNLNNLKKTKGVKQIGNCEDGKSWISQCIKKNMTFNCIMKLVKDYYEDCYNEITFDREVDNVDINLDMSFDFTNKNITKEMGKCFIGFTDFSFFGLKTMVKLYTIFFFILWTNYEICDLSSFY